MQGGTCRKRTHHLELSEAHMAGVGMPPRRTVGAGDIRDLPRRARPARPALVGWASLLKLERDMLERAHQLTDRLGGNTGIERRGVELGVTEQHLDHAYIGVLLEQVSGEAVP